ncbi:MAG: hypothetical protein JW732_02820 [Dehalococcoidia bacterium]|nr:hypothetical protein [Dehalococcoidia bacterium]
MGIKLIPVLAFSLFVLCPRMAGMANVIARYSGANLAWTVALGTLVAVPLVVGMALLFARFGLWAALALAIATDFGAAALMGAISMKAGIETIVVAVFVIAGVRVSTIVSGLFS